MPAPSLSSVQFSCSVMSDSLRPHESQHASPPCLSPTPGVYSNPCPLSWWCHPAISSSVIPFSCPQSSPASRSFPMSQLFASGGQSIGVSASASVLPMNAQDWSPLGWTGWISLQSNHNSWQKHYVTLWLFDSVSVPHFVFLAEQNSSALLDLCSLRCSPNKSPKKSFVLPQPGLHSWNAPLTEFNILSDFEQERKGY